MSCAPGRSVESWDMPIILIKHEAVPRGAAASKSGFQTEGLRATTIGMTNQAGGLGPEPLTGEEALEQAKAFARKARDEACADIEIPPEVVRRFVETCVRSARSW